MVRKRSPVQLRLIAVAAAVGVLTSGLVGGLIVTAPASEAAGGIPARWSTICPGRIGGAGTPLVAGANCRIISSGGLARRYVAYVPAAVAATPDTAPLVFMLHGSSGTGEQFLDSSGWRQVADREGAIVVFPTGMTYRVTDTGRMNTKWHDFGLSCHVSAVRPRGWPAGAPYPADDTGFVRSMIDDVDASEQIDHERIYASGFSNGSAFAQALAIKLADTLAAVGSWAGTTKECLDASGQPVEPIVPAAHPIPVALGLGAKDDRFLEPINAFRTTHGLPVLTQLPLDLAFVNGPFGAAVLRGPVEHNRLVWEPGTAIGVDDWAGAAWLPGWPAPRSVTARWSSAAQGNPKDNSFVFMLLDGVGHRYPNALPLRPSLIAQSGSVNAAELFWQFFERHPRPASGGAGSG